MNLLHHIKLGIAILLIYAKFVWILGDFIKLGKKKYRAGSDEMQAGGCRRQKQKLEFSVWHSKNFARIAKISQW